jgi:hypothetical protein
MIEKVIFANLSPCKAKVIWREKKQAVLRNVHHNGIILPLLKFITIQLVLFLFVARRLYSFARPN